MTRATLTAEQITERKGACSKLECIGYIASKDMYTVRVWVDGKRGEQRSKQVYVGSSKSLEVAKAMVLLANIIRGKVVLGRKDKLSADVKAIIAKLIANKAFMARINVLGELVEINKALHVVTMSYEQLVEMRMEREEAEEAYGYDEDYQDYYEEEWLLAA